MPRPVPCTRHSVMAVSLPSAPEGEDRMTSFTTVQTAAMQRALRAASGMVSQTTNSSITEFLMFWIALPEKIGCVA